MFTHFAQELILEICNKALTNINARDNLKNYNALMQTCKKINQGLMKADSRWKYIDLCKKLVSFRVALIHRDFKTIHSTISTIEHIKSKHLPPMQNLFLEFDVNGQTLFHAIAKTKQWELLEKIIGIYEGIKNSKKFKTLELKTLFLDQVVDANHEPKYNIQDIKMILLEIHPELLTHVLMLSNMSGQLLVGCMPPKIAKKIQITTGPIRDGYHPTLLFQYYMIPDYVSLLLDAGANPFASGKPVPYLKQKTFLDVIRINTYNKLYPPQLEKRIQELMEAQKAHILTHKKRNFYSW